MTSGDHRHGRRQVHATEDVASRPIASSNRGCRRMGSAWVLLALLVALGFRLGCSYQRPDRPDTTASNQRRRELGVRQIDDAWTLVRRRPNRYGKREVVEEAWAGSDGMPAKLVISNTRGQILREEDYFYTGRTFKPYDPDDSTPNDEEFRVVYTYSEDSFGVFYSGRDSRVKERIRQFLSRTDYHSDVERKVQCIALIRELFDLMGIGSRWLQTETASRPADKRT